MDAILQETILRALPETFWEHLEGVRFHIVTGVLTVIAPDETKAKALAIASIWADALDSVGCEHLVITDKANYRHEMTLESCVDCQILVSLECESQLQWLLYMETLPESVQQRLRQDGLTVHPNGPRLDLYAKPVRISDVLPLLYWLMGVESFGFTQVRLMENPDKPRLTLSVEEIRRLVRYGFNRLFKSA
ncbi:MULTISPECIES: hypothetical protein [unclassified Leptolyngbya]|uniref:hypothetical protein n=1 Tax=unclassified Leptolyngbya TaxID=2650499 RepID=UPI001681E3AB|nr:MULTISPECIES: hypothetical protein [unclassified Leptolyngbya]MBD1913974.1 hypothetical protein [Leptolyngbya sp. FACHB-8]MBD2155941.1 hypothetical protein [Leptolyngbya sp. FACHB-16]